MRTASAGGGRRTTGDGRLARAAGGGRDFRRSGARHSRTGGERTTHPHLRRRHRYATNRLAGASGTNDEVGRTEGRKLAKDDSNIKRERLASSFKSPLALSRRRRRAVTSLVARRLRSGDESYRRYMLPRVALAGPRGPLAVLYSLIIRCPYSFLYYMHISLNVFRKKVQALFRGEFMQKMREDVVLCARAVSAVRAGRLWRQMESVLGDKRVLQTPQRNIRLSVVQQSSEVLTDRDVVLMCCLNPKVNGNLDCGCFNLSLAAAETSREIYPSALSAGRDLIALFPRNVKSTR
ncbi:hypothetical protein EVAR_61580_1 [Eumeta japonica]|uniref:Uncharacterized protein n=1 Tax=Eumeta variegata TaxID=151549 RepID=A0A4C1YV78_EUMVA|nr:hypothetical protein EVAR_61580_1 [Eumeta japonica]